MNGQYSSCIECAAKINKQTKIHKLHTRREQEPRIEWLQQKKQSLKEL